MCLVVLLEEMFWETVCTILMFLVRNASNLWRWKAWIISKWCRLCWCRIMITEEQIRKWNFEPVPRIKIQIGSQVDVRIFSTQVPVGLQNFYLLDIVVVTIMNLQIKSVEQFKSGVFKTLKAYLFHISLSSLPSIWMPNTKYQIPVIKS